MIDHAQALQDLIELLSISAGPGEELAVVEYLRRKLAALGVAESQMQTDAAHRQSEYGGSTGNLLVRFDPALDAPPGKRLLLAAHMDTVQMAKGAEPRVEGSAIGNAAAGKAFGGDDRTGCAVLLQAARRLVLCKGRHPPVTLAFTVQEELGLVGSRGLDINALGEPKPSLGFNFDTDSAGSVYNQVIGTERYRALVRGRAAHSGCNPEDGVSAAVVAACALADLYRNGWHGPIEKEGGSGTANAGVLRGGEATNLVVPQCEVWAEARAHDRAFRDRIVRTWKEAFLQAAQAVRNARGECAEVLFAPGPVYEPCSLAPESPVVRLALDTIRRCGLEPRLDRDNGGSDTNWLNAHGIPTVTLGCGQRHPHTTAEYVDLPDFYRACEVAAALVG
jgi:tripeptide aminopeptidase